MRSYHILLVDDDSLILKTIGDALEHEGYAVTTAASGEAALTLLDDNDFDLLITDLIMDGVGRIAVLKKAKEILTDESGG